eukprot:5245023-Pyramimonas_sp.AAC.1
MVVLVVVMVTVSDGGDVADDAHVDADVVDAEYNDADDDDGDCDGDGDGDGGYDGVGDAGCSDEDDDREDGVA